MQPSGVVSQRDMIGFRHKRKRMNGTIEIRKGE